MAKPIVEKHSKSLIGTLNLNNMTMEFEDDIGTKELKDLLARFDGEYVTISVSLKSETEE